MAAVAALVAAPLLWFSRYLSVDQLVGGYVGELASATGLHPFLAKALAAALVIPALVGATWLFSFSERRRLAGKGIIAVMLAGYWGMLWLATKDQLVTRDDRPLRCFVVTEAGVRYRDIAYEGTDPETGRPCEPVRAELIAMLARLDAKLRSGQPVSPLPGAPERFFSAATGQAIVWYAEARAGEPEFFDTPGFDPRNGAALRPVTREVVQAHETRVARRAAEVEEAARRAEAERARVEAERGAAEQQAERARVAAERRAEQERLAREETARREAEAARLAEAGRQEQERLAEATRQEEARLARMAALLTAPARAGDRPRLGLAIAPARPEGDLDRAAAAALADALAGAGGEGLRVVPGAFAPAFFAEGHFARALAGDPAVLAETRAFERLDRVLLGTASAACEPNRQVAGLAACRVTLALRVVAADGSTAESAELLATGPGAGEVAAVRRGAELIVERQGQKLLANVGGRP